MLGERFGARLDLIAVAQSLRILIVVIVVPLRMTWWARAARITSP